MSAGVNGFRSNNRIADSGTGITQTTQAAPYISYCYGFNSNVAVTAIAINGEDFASQGLQLEFNNLKSSGAVTSGERFGRIAFGGDDGTNIIPGALIDAFVDGTPGANDMPGRIVLSTTADGAASPTERLRITSTGQVRLAGAGITFNGDTATANELDDYEEGTWTPVVSFGGASVGITGTFSGTYTKIGNVVTVGYILNFASKGSSTGVMLVSGMPFGAGNDIITGFGYIHRLAALQTAGQLYMQGVGTAFYPNFAGYNGGNTTNLTDTDITNTTDLRGGIVFMV